MKQPRQRLDQEERLRAPMGNIGQPYLRRRGDLAPTTCGNVVAVPDVARGSKKLLRWYDLAMAMMIEALTFRGPFSCNVAANCQYRVSPSAQLAEWVLQVASLRNAWTPSVRWESDWRRLFARQLFELEVQKVQIDNQGEQ